MNVIIDRVEAHRTYFYIEHFQYINQESLKERLKEMGYDTKTYRTSVFGMHDGMYKGLVSCLTITIKEQPKQQFTGLRLVREEA